MRRIRALTITLAALAALAAGVSPAAAKSSKSSGTPCWKLVVNDWFDNGRIDGTYPIACYTQAIQHIPEDARVYSSAPDDIRRAMLAAIREEGSGGGHGGLGHSGSDVVIGPNGNISGPGSTGGTGTLHRSFFERVADSVGPSNASSIPLPLLVLGGVAILLLLAAAMSWLARRMQARRVQVAPAPAPHPPKRP